MLIFANSVYFCPWNLLFLLCCVNVLIFLLQEGIPGKLSENFTGWYVFTNIRLSIALTINAQLQKKIYIYIFKRKTFKCLLFSWSQTKNVSHSCAPSCAWGPSIPRFSMLLVYNHRGCSLSQCQLNILLHMMVNNGFIKFWMLHDQFWGRSKCVKHHFLKCGVVIFNTWPLFQPLDWKRVAPRPLRTGPPVWWVCQCKLKSSLNAVQPYPVVQIYVGTHSCCSIILECLTIVVTFLPLPNNLY